MSRGKKILIWFLWALMLSPFIVLFTLIQLTSSGFFGDLPPLEAYETIEDKTLEASQIISSDGKVLGTYFEEGENRIPCRYEDISENVINALIATEDIRFRQHSGIDARSLFRAVFFLGKKGGASTITQQLAKLYYTENRSEKSNIRVMQKAREWVIAVQLEKRYTKNEILTMYLNKANWENDAPGIKTAAYTYFQKKPSDLNVKEAAVLVGMLKAPSAYDPTDNYDNSFLRRNVVLFQMKKYDFITEELFNDLKKDSIILNFARYSHDKGLAQYFREGVLKEELKKWFSDPITEKKLGKKYNLTTDGLKIYTTIDTRLQMKAEEAVKIHMAGLQEAFYTHWKYDKTTKKGEKNAPYQRLKNESEKAHTQRVEKIIQQQCESSPLGKKLRKDAKLTLAQRNEIYDTPVPTTLFSWEGEIQVEISPRNAALYNQFLMRSGMMSMDPKTGKIKAYVGGINFKHFQVDNVKKKNMSIEQRQVGSTFKPILYATAIEHGGAKPCDKFLSIPVTFEKGKKWGINKEYTPNEDKIDKNHDGKEITMKRGLARSLNHIAASILKQKLTSTSLVIQMARKMGITSELSPGPSICFGPDAISLYEMVGAYSSFVNKGYWKKPIFIDSIVDRNGVLIATKSDFEEEPVKAMSEETANIMVRMLQGSVEDGMGTAYRLRRDKHPVLPLSPQSLFPWKFTNQIGGKTGTTQNHADGWFIGITPNLVTGVWVGCDQPGARFKTLKYGQAATTALPLFGEYMKKVYEDSENTGIFPIDFDIPKDIDKQFICEELDGGETDEFDEFE